MTKRKHNDPFTQPHLRGAAPWWLRSPTAKELATHKLLMDTLHRLEKETSRVIKESARLALSRHKAPARRRKTPAPAAEAKAHFDLRQPAELATRQGHLFDPCD